MSVVITATAPVADVKATLTPHLSLNAGDSDLWLVDLSRGAAALGASALAQCYEKLGAEPADVHYPGDIGAFFNQCVKCAKISGYGLIMIVLMVVFW
jgi:phosphoribosylformylglycinamidine synthase